MLESRSAGCAQTPFNIGIAWYSLSTRVVLGSSGSPYLGCLLLVGFGIRRRPLTGTLYRLVELDLAVTGRVVTAGRVMIQRGLAEHDPCLVKTGRVVAQGPICTRE